MTQVQVNEGWEVRFEAIKGRMETASIWFYPHTLLTELVGADLITVDEYTRSAWKIELIGPFLRQQVLNMIKGTVKYSTDDWPTEVWKAMGRDDKVDSINYDLLFEDHLVKMGKL